MRGILHADLEKEKIRCKLEIEHATKITNGLKETIEELEKKKESLSKDNERLRSERSMNKSNANRKPLLCLPNSSIMNRFPQANKTPMYLPKMGGKENCEDTKSVSSNISGKSKPEEQKNQEELIE